MEPTSTQVVITGVGVVSSLGTGRQAFWQGMLEGRTGFATPQVHAVGTLPLPLVGEVIDFDPARHIAARKTVKLMCRETQLACAAAALAIDDAGIDPKSLVHDRMGVIFGSEMLYGQPVSLQEVFARSMESQQFNMDAFGHHFVHEMTPLWLLNYLPNMAACHIGIAHQACGPCNTIVQGDASGLLAMMEAGHVIQRGWADVMLVGSFGNLISPTRQVHMCHDRLLRDAVDPLTACRPFDGASRGMVAAEGAAALMLESREHAERRGAKICAELVASASSWGMDPSQRRTSRRAIADSIRRCLDRGQLSLQQIDHVNAHGTGSLELDREEAAGIQDALGSSVSVTAPKSYVGHAGAGCGAIEAVVSVLSLEHGLVPPICHFQQIDPECPIQVIAHAPRKVASDYMITLNQSTTGQAAAVALRRVS